MKQTPGWELGLIFVRLHASDSEGRVKWERPGPGARPHSPWTRWGVGVASSVGDLRRSGAGHRWVPRRLRVGQGAFSGNVSSRCFWALRCVPIKKRHGRAVNTFIPSGPSCVSAVTGARPPPPSGNTAFITSLLSLLRNHPRSPQTPWPGAESPFKERCVFEGRVFRRTDLVALVRNKVKELSE